jgi:hypothetical protein
MLAAIAMLVVALLEINKREKEGPSVAAPTAIPSPISALPAKPKESVSPPSTPAPTPPLPSPTPLHIPGASPMPHTGGGALPAGLEFIAAAAVLAVVARRAY